jgi:hypothetical protein
MLFLSHNIIIVYYCSCIISIVNFYNEKTLKIADMVVCNYKISNLMGAVMEALVINSTMS